eukprot:1678753-Rhodomonas_salina.4
MTVLQNLDAVKQVRCKGSVKTVSLPFCTVLLAKRVVFKLQSGVTHVVETLQRYHPTKRGRTASHHAPFVPLTCLTTLEHEQKQLSVTDHATVPGYPTRRPGLPHWHSDTDTDSGTVSECHSVSLALALCHCHCHCLRIIALIHRVAQLRVSSLT